MKDLFKEYLFTKHVLVASELKPNKENSFNTLVALANKFAIKITKGMELASHEMIEFAAKQLGEYVPAPFYRGFPNSVRELTEDQLLFDQLFHYIETYGYGNFDEVGHSVFEKDFERLAFEEDVKQKEFEILTEEEATDRLHRAVLDLLESSRPLSENDYNIVLETMRSYMMFPKTIPCKQTAVRLLYDMKSALRFSRYLNLADVIKLVDYINYKVYDNENLKKLNLKNKDRKLITEVIDTCFANQQKVRREVQECFEKRKIWCGLLHHIHYQPKNDYASQFVAMIRSGENISVYSRFEEEMAADNVVEAARVLAQEKGSSVVIRNLNYLLSRCRNEDDVKGVLSWVK